MSKLNRSALMHYLDATFGGETPEWFLIGKDIEDMSVELNADVATKKNILGENTVEDNGYEPQMSADPYYANPSDQIYPKIRDIALERKKGDECRTKVLEVLIEDPAAESHIAYMEDAVVKPQSYGGGTEGINIPYDVHYAGNRIKGKVTIAAGVPTFTAD